MVRNLVKKTGKSQHGFCVNSETVPHNIYEIADRDNLVDILMILGKNHKLLLRMVGDLISWNVTKKVNRKNFFDSIFDSKKYNEQIISSISQIDY